MNELRLYLSYWHKDANGKTIKYRRYRSDSFVGNFFKLLFASLFRATFNNTASETVRLFDPVSGNAIINVNNESTQNYGNVASTILAGIGVTDLGIVVGSGSTPVTLDDFRLVSQIPHGTSAGQLIYTAMTSSNITPINRTLANNWYYIITRQFDNLSPSTVTIAEVGLIGRFGTGIGFLPALVARDVLPSSITLEPNQSTVIQYTIRLTI
jgi:hypothetical protein